MNAVELEEGQATCPSEQQTEELRAGSQKGCTLLQRDLTKLTSLGCLLSKMG